MGLIGCPKTSVTTSHSCVTCQKSEALFLHLGGSLKFEMILTDPNHRAETCGNKIQVSRVLELLTLIGVLGHYKMRVYSSLVVKLKATREQ